MKEGTFIQRQMKVEEEQLDLESTQSISHASSRGYYSAAPRQWRRKIDLGTIKAVAQYHTDVEEARTTQYESS
jgi:hypothetical protein